MAIELDVDGLVVYLSTGTSLHLVTEAADALLDEGGAYVSEESGSSSAPRGEQTSTENVVPILTEGGLNLITETGVALFVHFTTEDGNALLDEAGGFLSMQLGRTVSNVPLATEANDGLLTEAGDNLSVPILSSQGLAEGTSTANAVGRFNAIVANANGRATVLGVGQALKVATATASATAVVAGRSFTGFAGFAAGHASALGVGVANGGFTSQHVQLFVDGVEVFETGGGLTYVATANGRATVAGIGGSIRSGVGRSAGTSVAHAQGLLPGQTIASASGSASVNAGVQRTGVAQAFGVARVGSPLDDLTEQPLTGRGMTALMQAAIQLPIVRPIFLFQGQFKDGMLNLWTGYGKLNWNGIAWDGAGGLLSISTVEEIDQQQASGVVVQLTGVPSSEIALALASVQRNMPGQIWLGLIDEANRLIEDPQTMFRGRLDTVTIEDSEQSAVIKASYENEMITLEHAREVRYTDEEQKRLYPEDRGLEFVASIQDLTLRWGSRG